MPSWESPWRCLRFMHSVVAAAAVEVAVVATLAVPVSAVAVADIPPRPAAPHPVLVAVAVPPRRAIVLHLAAVLRRAVAVPRPATAALAVPAHLRRVVGVRSARATLPPAIAVAAIVLHILVAVVRKVSHPVVRAVCRPKSAAAHRAAVWMAVVPVQFARAVRLAPVARCRVVAVCQAAAEW